MKDDYKEVSLMGKGSSNKEPGNCFYAYITNKEDKICKKLRRCIIYQKLNVIYCYLYTKSYYYVVGRKKHNHKCLEDYIKIMKKNNCFRHTRSYTI